VPNSEPNVPPREIFLAAFSADFLEATIRTLAHGYLRAYEYCSEHYQQPEARDLRGDVRRAEIEQGWRATASGFPGVTADTHPNKADNCSHTRVECGGVVLVQNHVQSRNQIVRPAAFRSGLANMSQLVLFPSEQAPEIEDADGKLFAIVLHGNHPKYPDRLAFVQVAFPNIDCSDYVTTFDLLHCFPALSEEVIPDLGTPEPRPTPRLREHDTGIDIEGRPENDRAN
jgi:hypothetical protein